MPDFMKILLVVLTLLYTRKQTDNGEADRRISAAILCELAEKKVKGRKLQ
jgi:hypothetical protein